MRGITGPKAVFEGNKGFMDLISGQFEIDWEKEDLELVRSTVLKKYNAEVHSQSTLEGALELKNEFRFKPGDIERIEIETFDVAFHIIGGGEEGDKKLVRIKEQADHSLPYMVAVALIDGQIMPEQYLPERIVREDVQSLLRKITIKPSSDLSDQFPASMPCRIRIFLKNKTRIFKEKRDFEGYHTNPMKWEKVVQKFNALVGPHNKKKGCGMKLFVPS
jgi:2-methylcitrate dehydratase